MAHFAHLKNGVVQNVIVVSNDDCGGGDFPESEPIGQQYLASLATLDKEGVYLQTSMHNNFRKRYAAAGYTYSEEHDAFIPPKPYDSWILNDDLDWEAPVPRPEGNDYAVWDEHSQTWLP